MDSPIDQNKSEDILMQFTNDQGVILTVMTAPPDVFKGDQTMEPLVTGWDKEIYVVFNAEVVEQAMRDSIEQNIGEHDENESSGLAILDIMRKGIEMGEKYAKDNNI